MKTKSLFVALLAVMFIGTTVMAQGEKKEGAACEKKETKECAKKEEGKACCKDAKKECSAEAKKQCAKDGKKECKAQANGLEKAPGKAKAKGVRK